MTDETLELLKTNPYRSEEPVRQLSATDLGISAPNTSSSEIWDELHGVVDSISGDRVRVGIATADGMTTSATNLQEGKSRAVHAIELGVWKAYSEAQSPITHVLVQGVDEDYNPCGRCLQTLLDYSGEVLLRIVGSDDSRTEYSLNQSPLLTRNEDPEKGQKEDSDENDEPMPIPDSPPFLDIEPNTDDEIEYIRLNAPVYHLKYQSHNQTFCGTDLTHRESVSSSERPNLLDPCKRCHGETHIETVEEQRIQLRSEVADRVEQVREVEEEADTFTEEEIDAILGRIPVEVPDGGTDSGSLRDRLSDIVIDVHDDQENPLTLSRTEIEALLEALDGEGIISDTPNLFVSTSTGRVARITLSDLSPQHRAGKGKLALSLDAQEYPVITFDMSPRERLYVVTNQGLIHEVEAHRIPLVGCGDKPAPLSDIVELDEDETLQCALTSRDITSQEYLLIGTKNGYIKRTPTEEFENIRRGGIRAIELEGDDVVREACPMDEGQEILMTTSGGRSIRFDGDDARPMRRAARGVLGIELDDNDEVVAVNAVDSIGSLKVLTVTSRGYGKRTSLEEYRIQTRNGRGLVDISTGGKNGEVVAVEIASDKGGDIVTISQAGYSIRFTIDEVSIQGRNTKGVDIMSLNPEDELSDIALFE
jgi:cytidine deaminase